MGVSARWFIGLLVGAVLAAILFASRDTAFVVIGAATLIGFTFGGAALTRK